MTYEQQAVEEIRCALSYGCGDYISEQVLDTALIALEKQIPKKPEYEAWGYADGVLAYDYAKCPVCGHDFEEGINDWGCAYCQDCGCALDWSDTE